MAMIRQMELLLILHSRANGRWRGEDERADCAELEWKGPRASSLSTVR